MTRLRPTALCAALAMAFTTVSTRRAARRWLVGAVCAASIVPVQAQTVAIDVPAGPLQAALVGFSVQTRVSLQFEAQTVSQRRTAGVKGTLPVAMALEQLLKDSGLLARRVADNVYSIDVAPPVVAVAPPAAPTAVPAPVVAAKAVAPAQELPQVEIVGTAVSSAGYVAARSATSTRTTTALGLTPQTIDVVTRAVLDQQQSASVGDALRNVPGVSLSSVGGFAGQVYLRGLSASVAINGTTDGASGVAGFGFSSAGLGVPIQGIQGIEVLKGADAIVAGSPGNSPSFGLVNVELKKPQAAPIREVSAELGSYGHKQLGLDLGDAVDAARTLNYRLVVDSREDDRALGSFRGGQGSYVAPSLLYRQGGTSLLLGADVKHETSAPSSVTFIDFDGSIARPVPPVGQFNDHGRIKSESAYLDWQQPLPDNWQLRLRLKGSRITAWASSQHLTTDDYVTVGFLPSSSRSTLRKNDVDLSLSRSFSLGETTHKLLFGGNFQSLALQYGSDNPATMTPLGQVLAPVDDYTGELHAAGHITDTSLFVQDQIRWGDVHALLALTRSSEWGVYGLFSSPLVRQDATNPSLGLLYQASDAVALYVNARKSFSPQASILLFDQRVAPPQVGESRELGTKVYLNDDRLVLNLAYFNNTTSNSIQQQPDGAHLGPGFRSKGLELSLNGELAAGLRSVLSYSYMKLAYDGGYWPADSYPRQTLRVFVNYDLPTEPLRGWRVGGGVTARSGYQINYVNLDYITALMSDPSLPLPTRRMPGQAEWEAQVGYAAKQWSLSLGVKNLGKRTLYGDWAQQLLVPVNSDRVATLSAKFSF